MKYWWVNQNQTHKHEIGNGYMWSPKTSKGGGRNQFYINMTRVALGDLVFSFSNQKISYVGKIKSKAYETPKPSEFGSAGANWATVGWKVDVDWTPMNEQVVPKEIIHDLVPHLPDKYSPIRTNGEGNQVYLCEIPEAMAEILLLNANESSQATLDEFDEEESKIIQDIQSDPNLATTEIKNLISSRRGQGKFRSRLEKIEQKCRVTKLADKRFLIASHIKPWRVSSNEERLDGHNGLLLCPNIDKLFDGGYISFSDDGQMITSPQISSDTLRLMNVNITNNKFGKFTEKQKRYLKYHRKNVLKSSE